MDKLKNDIDDLKAMQNNPKLYLVKYFCELKLEINSLFVVNERDRNNCESREKYMEIMKTIESFERETYDRIKPFNTFDEIIELFEQQQQLSVEEETSNELSEEIDQVKFKIEQKIFSDKSVIFMKNYGFNNLTFLLINDVYIRKLDFDTDSDCLNRRKLIAILIKNKLNKLDLNIKTNIINLDINITKQFNIDITREKLKEIDPFTFDGLNDLKQINFGNNKLEKLDPEIFNDLTCLMYIDLDYNQIQEIDPNLFNSTRKLTVLNLSNNQIKRIDPKSLSSLNNLQKLYLGNNKIKELDSSTFSGLVSLKYINLEHNQLEELDEHIFSELTNLKWINFNKNRIKNLNSNIFIGLINLEEIHFNNNQIKVLDSILFAGLNKLKEIDFEFNQINKKELHPDIFKGLLKNVKFKY